jgi:hypothetical protein
MITSVISRNFKVEYCVEKGEILRKLLVLEEREGFHRVWNFVVPLHKLVNNSHIQSIPPLTKNSHIKIRKTRKKITS